MFSLFFFNDTATTEIYTLSLHDALPISSPPSRPRAGGPAGRSPRRGAYRRRRTPPTARWSPGRPPRRRRPRTTRRPRHAIRSEEHTSELQSRQYLVCRLLLEKKKNKNKK